MNAIAHVIQDVLAKREILHAVDQEDGSIRFIVGIAHGQMWFTVKPEDDFLTVFAHFPFNVPHKRRKEVGHFLMQANNSPRMGCFIMDFKSGGFCFHIPMPLVGLAALEENVEEVFEMMMDCILFHTERAWPFIDRVIHNNMSGLRAAQAYDSLKQSCNQDDDGSSVPAALIELVNEQSN